MSQPAGQPAARSAGARRALISVTDKTGVVEFARALHERGFEVLSTGGTARVLRDAGVPVTDVASVTGFPEMLDGRVKTLHPAIHGGLLARRDLAGHMAALREHGLGPIDVVAVSLYAFRQAAAQPGATDEEVIEHIDIGGPSMIRSAAKNHRDVWVVCAPADYGDVLEGLDREVQDPALARELRRQLAARAYRATAAYDAAIANWFDERLGAALPATLVLEAGPAVTLRYGENPQQRAAFYPQSGAGGASLATAKQLAGKELSYNNILDADAALELVKEFDRAAAAIIKHANPCGCGLELADAGPVEAYRRALAGDPQSAFGGIVAVNRGVDAALAAAIALPETFFEVILAPEFSAEAIEILTTRCKWGRNVRLLSCGPLREVGGIRRSAGAADSSAVAPARTLRQVHGGLLLQERDEGFVGEERRVVSARAPSPEELAALEFAWRVCKHVRSNAIVLARCDALGCETVGIGAGQMSRVDSVFMAGHKAGPRARLSVLASDAFFPFRDSIDTAARLGVTAVIQPGGSLRDKESIAAADEHGLALLFTGRRHFRH
ncbi:MAG: bifunctional phosphoribosylaminoimidazolecarboxamide formyltransferase/IMP cyclohydrolase [Planctomycetota bacterium]